MIPQLQRETPTPATETVAHWSLPTRIAFRFTFVYFFLWVYPRAVGSLGKAVQYSNPVRALWHALVPWVGAHVLHLHGYFGEIANGSGDQLYDYILVFCITVIAALITVIWSVLDRKRTAYVVLYEWLRFLVRLKLAMVMIDYGTAKLWRAQFPLPRLERLIEPYGQTQPADLMWTFMGMSRAYSLFGGIGEMLGAVLLLFPRLVTLGSLVTAAVMTNVFILNMGYDVPRKILSIHLLLMCLFLVLPDLRRLMDFFVLNRPAQLTKPVPLFSGKLSNALLAASLWAMAIVTFGSDSSLYSKSAQGSVTSVPAAIRGIWRVDELFVDSLYRPPLVTDTDHWRRVVLDSPDVFIVQPMDGPEHRYREKLDPTKKIITLWKPGTPDNKETLTYDYAGPDRLTLDGQLNGQRVSAKLSRLDLSDPVNFALTNRGFEWVNLYMHWSGQEENWH